MKPVTITDANFDDVVMKSDLTRKDFDTMSDINDKITKLFYQLDKTDIAKLPKDTKEFLMQQQLIPRPKSPTRSMKSIRKYNI